MKCGTVYIVKLKCVNMNVGGLHSGYNISTLLHFGCILLDSV